MESVAGLGPTHGLRGAANGPAVLRERSSFSRAREQKRFAARFLDQLAACAGLESALDLREQGEWVCGHKTHQSNVVPTTMKDTPYNMNYTTTHEFVEVLYLRNE